MKRLLLISITLITTSLILSAAQIDQATAKKVAENFYLQNSKKQIKDIRLAYIENGDSGSLVFYVFNINENDGWVMVSADDAVTPILGYNTVGHYTAKGTSPEFDYWKNTYKKHIDFIKSQRIQPTKEIKTRWSTYENIENIIRTRVSSVVVEPLLGDIQWGQGTFYNDFCPQMPLDIGKAATGCVITAQAQIMKYWKWPSFGNGTTTPYEVKQKIDDVNYNGTPMTLSWQFQIPSINLSAANYDWSKMPNQLMWSPNNEIAKLMYHIGASIRAVYGINTAAYQRSENYTKHFGYDETATQIEAVNFASISEWISILKSEINSLRPIQFGGFAWKSGPGHSWVIDGYDSNDMFHMNWGWNGAANGYYEITLTTPDVPGYKSDQMAIIGIKPSECFITYTTPPFSCTSRISFKSSASIAVNSYQWTINGKSALGANNPTYTSTTLKENDTVRCVINKDTPNEAVSNFIIVSPIHIIPTQSLKMSDGSRSEEVDVEIFENNTVLINEDSTVLYGDSIVLISSLILGNQWYENGKPIKGATSNWIKIKSNSYYYCTNSQISDCSSDTIHCVILPLTEKANIIIDRETLCKGDGLWLKSSIPSMAFTNKWGYERGIRTNWIKNDYGLALDKDSIWITEAGIYILNVFNDYGNYNLGSSSDTVSITFSEPVLPTITINTTDNSVDWGYPVTFTAITTNAGDAPFYQWTVNGKNIEGNSNSFTTSSLYNGDTIKCLLTSNHYCLSTSQSSSNEIIIKVNPPTITVTQPTEENFSGTIIVNPLSKKFTYSIDGKNYQASNIFPDLSIGNYSVTIKNDDDRISQPILAVINTSKILTNQNYKIKATNSGCINSNEGKIEITTEKSYNYNVTLKSNNSKTEKFTGTSYSFTKLAAGTYELCFTIDGLENYSQCFDVVINQPQDLSVFKSGISGNRAVYTLSGGTRYAIEYNGKMIETTEKTVEVPLLRGRNVIRITTDSQCQGVYEDIVYSNETDDIILFPNPTTGQFSMIVPGEDIEVTVEIVSIIGSIMIKEKKKVPINRLVNINAFSLQNGVYLVKVSGKTVNSVVKLLKNNL